MHACTIKAEASVVANEVDLEDNTFIDGTVTILLALSATVDLDPDTLNLESKGKWITCYIELPEGYDTGDNKRRDHINNDRQTL